MNEYIFLIAHHRSRSSLLAHILGSHPEISGYAELQISYAGRQALPVMSRRIAETLADGRPLGRYHLDKVLIGVYKISAEVLQDETVRTIFLLRPPQPTFNSGLRAKPGVSRAEEFVRITTSYQARLKEMAGYAEAARPGALFIDSDDLIDHPQAVFRFLEKQLGLASPLSDEYRTFPFTGVYGYGDYTANIHAGKILYQHRPPPVIQLAPGLAKIYEQAYHACRQTLLAACLSPEIERQPAQD